MSKKSYDLDDFDYLDDDLAFLLESLSTDEDGEFVEDNVEAVRAGVGIADRSFSYGARSA